MIDMRSKLRPGLGQGRLLRKSYVRRAEARFGGRLDCVCPLPTDAIRSGEHPFHFLVLASVLKAFQAPLESSNGEAFLYGWSRH